MFYLLLKPNNNLKSKQSIFQQQSETEQKMKLILTFCSGKKYRMTCSFGIIEKKKLGIFEEQFNLVC